MSPLVVTISTSYGVVRRRLAPSAVLRRHTAKMTEDAILIKPVLIRA
jgi:hypothetical protein